MGVSSNSRAFLIFVTPVLGNSGVVYDSQVGEISANEALLTN
jgi:hypothetical protein